MSDLHLEMYDLDISLESADVLILAGDITTKANIEWINKQAQIFNHVIYINGNHEFYHGHLDVTLEITANRLASNVHYLDNSSVDIDGVRFHGTTMWTDINKGDPMTRIRVADTLNDFRLITFGDGTCFDLGEWVRRHHESRRYLRNYVRPGDVVITHHCPHKNSCHPKYGDAQVNHLFYCDMKEIFDLQPSFWIHGHTHDSFDYVIDGTTRVLCNPRGYGGENRAFDINASFVIDYPK